VLQLRPHPGCGLPGRHRPVLDHDGDVLGPLPGLRIRFQGKWTDLASAMATQALLIDDRSHVLGIGRWRDLRGRHLSGRHAGEQPEGPESDSDPDSRRPARARRRPHVVAPHVTTPLGGEGIVLNASMRCGASGAQHHSSIDLILSTQLRKDRGEFVQDKGFDLCNLCANSHPARSRPRRRWPRDDH